MDMIADILLVAGALGAAIYCVVLAGRLKRFNNLQNGVGGAVAVLSAQVDDMTKTLQKAQKAAVTSSVTLTSLTERAEDVSKRLELMLASMHDLPGPEQSGPDESAGDTGKDAGKETGKDTGTDTGNMASASDSDAASASLSGPEEGPPEKVLFTSNRTLILEAAQ